MSAGPNDNKKCKLYDKSAKRSIAWKNAFLVTSLFLVLGSPLLYRSLGNLIMSMRGGSPKSSPTPRYSPRLADMTDLDGIKQTLQNNLGFLDKDFKSKAVQALGGVRISVLQHLFHSLLAGLITWLVTYYSMTPDEDQESCPKVAPVDE